MIEPIPRVSIGMPVYNGGARLRVALNSLLAQTWSDLELIVSDNASTDETPGVVGEYQARDPRVRYVCNAENVGAMGNFDRVLRLARGDYFMWASHDDRWAPEFVAENLAQLESDPSLVACMSQAAFVDGEKVVKKPFWVSHGTGSLRGTPEQNLRRFLVNPGQCLRFYAMFRRSALVKCLPLPTFCGFDCALVVRSLQFGQYQEVPRILFYKSIGGESSDQVYTLRGDGRSRVGRFLPLWQFSRDIWQLEYVRRTWGSAAALAFLNMHWSAVLLKATLWRALGLSPGY